ncbi:MAG: BlaI/MecI/CopY family transcriptional regulator [Chitinophagaceae bacterium]|nr:BlaI/MecI/CopY family transcriptional regulator [Chitinophagaceae bacterium]
MIKLSKTEEQLMEFVWQKGKAFMKDLIDSYPDPKPASTTIATLLKRMTEKGAVGYKQMGNSREYYPLIRKSDYFSKRVNTMIRDYFDDSVLQFASFFTRETQLTKKELEELKKIIDSEIQKKK